MTTKRAVIILSIIFFGSVAVADEATPVKRNADPATQCIAVAHPAAESANRYYVSNRAPLKPTPLVELPVGSIRPRGWLRKQLELQMAGFHGHLEEISDFLRRPNNAWLDPQGRGDHGWEEVPYWLKGFCNAAYVLGDKKQIDAGPGVDRRARFAANSPTAGSAPAAIAAALPPI